MVTRELALEEVWGGEGEASPNAVDRYVAYLRRKLGDPPLIHTVRGVGFRLQRRAEVSRVSLRWRVALASAVAIVLAVVLLGVATLTLLDNQLHDTLDRSLRARAVDVARLAAATPRLLTEPGALEGRVGSGPALVAGGRPARADRRPLERARRARAARRGAAERRRARPPRRLRRRAPGRRSVRVYAAPLGELGGGPAAGGAVVVAGATGDIEDTLRTTRGLVALCAVAAAILAALLSVLLTRRALRPLGRLSAGAEAIARTGDAPSGASLPPPRATRSASWPTR